MCCAEVSDSSVNHLCLSVKETSDSLWMTQKLVESLNSIHQILTHSLTLSLSLSLCANKAAHLEAKYLCLPVPLPPLLPKLAYQ